MRIIQFESIRPDEKGASIRSSMRFDGGPMPAPLGTLPPPDILNQPAPPVPEEIKPPNHDPMLSKDPRLQKEIELEAVIDQPLTAYLTELSSKAGVATHPGAEPRGKRFRLTYAAVKAPVHTIMHDLALHYGLVWKASGKSYVAECASPRDPLADDLRRIGEPMYVHHRRAFQPAAAVEALKADAELMKLLETGNKIEFQSFSPAQRQLLEGYLNYKDGERLWSKLDAMGDPLNGYIVLVGGPTDPLTIGYQVGGVGGSITPPPGR